MSIQWSAVQSFQHNQDLLRSINALSIHIKLKQVGISDDERSSSAESARKILASFLTDLEAVVSETQQKGESPVVGVNPRLRQLARNFVGAKTSHSQFRSALFRNGLSEVRRLLDSANDQDQTPLLQCLEELRVLLEEHMHVDASQLLGEI